LDSPSKEKKKKSKYSRLNEERKKQIHPAGNLAKKLLGPRPRGGERSEDLSKRTEKTRQESCRRKKRKYLRQPPSKGKRGEKDRNIENSPAQ